MKKLFFLLLIILSQNGFSQDYPMPDSGAVWSNEYFQYGGNPPQVYYYGWQYTHYCTNGEDTTINAEVYTKIDTCTAGYKGAFRNDSCLVYFVPKGETTEYLLYDFCPTVGDTLFNVYQEDGLTDLIIVGSSADSLQFGGTDRNVVTTSDGAIWIEGIGNSAGLFLGTGANVSMFFIDLICHSVDGSKIYPNYHASGCDLTVSIQPQDFNFNIYPNPVENSLTIELDNINELISAQIFDINGKEMSSFELESLSNQIDLSELEAGIYLMHLSSSYTTKVVRLVKL